MAADEQRRTDSGIPVRPFYSGRRRGRPPRPRQLSRTRAACAPTATGSGPGRCASTPASRSAEETNSRFRLLLERGQTGLSVAFDLPTQLGLDSDHPLARGEVGRTGVAIDSIEDMRLLLAGIPLGEVSTSMTINAPGLAAAAALRAGGRGAGRRRRAAVRHDPERHPQGVHRPRQLHLPGPAQHAADRRHVPLLHRAAAALEHDLDLGLPHPRGRLDGRPGAGLHARQRHRLRAGGGGRGPRGGRLRAAAVVLLQRPQRLLPGGRQVPRRPHAVGRDDARPLRRPATSAA